MYWKILGLSALALGLGFVQTASAADLPVKAPVYKAAPMMAYNWTGFYLGVHGGGGWARENQTDNIAVGFPPGSATSFSPDGGIFGGQGGYRWQQNQFVLGIEGTGAWADLRQDVAKGAPGETVSLRVRSLYSATGQVGWANNQWLFYVKGGWAGANTRQTLTAPGVGGFTGTNSQNNNGWVVGGGVDYAVMQNIVFGVEYDHFDLGYKNFTQPLSNGGIPFTAVTSRLTVDQVVGRISYKF